MRALLSPRVATSCAVGFLSVLPLATGADGDTQLRAATKAVKCLNLSGMAIINCLRGMGGGDKATRMWFWDYINGKKSSSRSKELRKLNQPGGQVDKTRVGVYCYLRQNRSDVLTDLQRDLGGQGVDAAKAQTGYELFLKELLEAVKWNLKVKTNPAHAKLLRAQAQPCQRELLAAVGQTLPGVVATKTGARPPAPASGAFIDTNKAKPTPLPTGPVSKLALDKQPCKKEGGRDVVLSEGWKRSAAIPFCLLAGPAFAKLDHVKADKRVHIAGASEKVFDGAKSENKPRILKGEVFQVIGLSRGVYTHGTKPPRKGVVFKVRYGDKQPHEGWLHAYYVKQFTPKCQGTPRWENGILACTQKATRATTKGANLWAKNGHWVARFGLLKGTSVGVVAKSLNKHWKKYFVKVRAKGGSAGWVQEDKVSTARAVRTAPIPAFAGVDRAKPFERMKVKAGKALQAYTYSFRDAGKIPPGTLTYVSRKSKHKWWDGTTYGEERYVWVDAQKISGWVREAGLQTYQPPPPPTPAPKKQACPKASRKADPVLVAKLLHSWYLNYLQARADKAKFFGSGGKLNYAMAYCHLWEPHRKHSDNDPDWIRKPLKVEGKNFFTLLRKDSAFKCLSNRWLHAGLSFYREALLENLKRAYMSLADSAFLRKPRFFGQYIKNASTFCKDFLSSIPGWAEKGEGYQVTWKDTLYEKVASAVDWFKKLVEKVKAGLKKYLPKIWWDYIWPVLLKVVSYASGIPFNNLWDAAKAVIDAESLLRKKLSSGNCKALLKLTNADGSLRWKEVWNTINDAARATTILGAAMVQAVSAPFQALVKVATKGLANLLMKLAATPLAGAIATSISGLLGSVTAGLGALGWPLYNRIASFLLNWFIDEVTGRIITAFWPQISKKAVGPLFAKMMPYLEGVPGLRKLVTGNQGARQAARNKCKGAGR